MQYPADTQYHYLVIVGATRGRVMWYPQHLAISPIHEALGTRYMKQTGPYKKGKIKYFYTKKKLLQIWQTLGN